MGAARLRQFRGAHFQRPRAAISTISSGCGAPPSASISPRPSGPTQSGRRIRRRHDGGMSAANIVWVAADPASLRVLEIAEKLAETATTLLITGESGTGKDQLARWIHEPGPRRDAPFLKIDCASLPSELVESELFGHERGAFTGAVARKPGTPGNGAGRHHRSRRSGRARARNAGEAVCACSKSAPSSASAARKRCAWMRA